MVQFEAKYCSIEEVNILDSFIFLHIIVEYSEGMSCIILINRLPCLRLSLGRNN